MGSSERFGALSERPFRLLWAARATSSIGDRMVPIALTFAVLDLTLSASALGIVLAAGLIPNVMLVLFGGVAGDRWRRDHVMLTSDLLRALSQAVVAVLLLTSHAELWHLVVSSAMWGTAAAFFSPASTGIVRETVSRERLQQANALMGLTRNAVGLGGPALAGIIIATAGTGFVFAIDAATFLLSAVFLAKLRLPARELRPGESLRRELADGWKELASRSWLWATILSGGVWNIGLAFFLVIGPVVVARDLGGARDWGLIMSGTAAGGLLGGAIALRWRPSRPLVAMYLLLGISMVQLLAMLPPAPVPVIAASAFFSMAAASISAALWMTALQQHVPPEAMARVSAYDWLGSLVAAPAGYAIAGPLAAVSTTDTVLVAGAGCILLSSAVPLLLPSIWRLRSDDPPGSDVLVPTTTAAAPGPT